jgi:hypothetical protein
MPPPNVREFDVHVACYLSKLYRSFPTRDYITPEDVGISLDDFDDRQFEAAVAAAHWLLDEGYIRGEPHPAGVMLAVLTSRSWDVLQRPSSLDRQKTWGDVIIGAARDVGKDARGQTVGLVLSALAGRIV